MAAKIKYYMFIFSDGYSTICRGMSAQERRVIERDHGKFLYKTLMP